MNITMNNPNIQQMFAMLATRMRNSSQRPYERLMMESELLLGDLLQLDGVLHTNETLRECIDLVHQSVCTAHAGVFESSTYQQMPPLNLKAHSGGIGRPSYDIPKAMIEYLVYNDIKVKDIACILGCSSRTIERKMQEYDLYVRDTYSLISQLDLEKLVSDILQANPDIGIKSVMGHLRVSGHKVQEYKVRLAVKKVDPEGVLFRRMFMQMFRIQRRVYNVRAPLALWHMDGNHKLIRWRFVIHGVIDGYSRLPVSLVVVANNKAETVFQAFLMAVSVYGLPERVRSDKGMENIRVAEFMTAERGTGRGSHITGRSVHNQRIERLWRELWFGFTGFYYNLFKQMESEGILDIDDEIDIALLHYYMLPRMRIGLEHFRQALCHRKIRTEGSRSPHQLWITGLLLDPKWEPQNQHDLDTYGIDYEGSVPQEGDAQRLEVPPVAQIENRYILPNPQSSSNCFNVDLYCRAREIIANSGPNN